MPATLEARDYASVEATRSTAKAAVRVPELDGIRGLAIVLVLIWHFFVALAEPERPATLLSYMQAACRLTWTGVDLFFVLSGFLIGGILLDHKDSPTFFKIFYARRFFRIVPLYVVTLSLVYAFIKAIGTTQVVSYRWDIGLRL